MLSYMLPVEEKSATTTTTRNYNLSLNLNGQSEAEGAAVHQNGGAHHSNGSHNMTEDLATETTKLLTSERDDHEDQNGIMMEYKNTKGSKNNSNCSKLSEQQQQLLGDDSLPVEDDSFDTEASTSSRLKIGKLPVGQPTTKRVSFGSSKVEVFETQTPLPEHAEREFNFPDGGQAIGGDDSGIELQEELERSKVVVSFFQSSQPQQVSPPELLLFDCGDTNISSYNDLNNNATTADLLQLYGKDLGCVDNPEKMAAVANNHHHAPYDRQLSTESGWDNPFRPGGDLSREADEIVNRIKDGKPITPTGDPEHSHLGSNGTSTDPTTNGGTTMVDGATKVEASQLNSANSGVQNGVTGGAAAAKSPQKSSPGVKNGGDGASSPQTQVVPGPQSASHVIIEDKKKKKCTCCVLQ